MSIKVGEIVDGTVTGITNFGAFIGLDEDKSGLVHISEISNEYVKNVESHLKIGDKVKVKVISMDNNKIALSIKQTLKKEASIETKKTHRRENREVKKPENLSFEDKLEQFFKISNEKNDQLRSRDGKWGHSGNRY